MRDLGLADRIRAKGVTVVEVAGWQTRGSSTFNPLGSVNHHTAGSPFGTIPSLDVLINGRAGIPGPLCNSAQSREGGNGLSDKAYIIASGRANHAGLGSWRGLTGNSRVYGHEVEHVGNAHVPVGRLEISARIQAAMLEGTPNPNAGLCCQHFEWAPTRKVDFSYLSPWSPDQFRNRVGYWIGRSAEPAQEEEDVLNTFLMTCRDVDKGFWWVHCDTAQQLTTMDTVHILLRKGIQILEPLPLGDFEETIKAKNAEEQQGLETNIRLADIQNVLREQGIEVPGE